MNNLGINEPLTFGWRRKMRAADEFSSVFRFRCSHGKGGLDVLVAPNDLPHARLGMIVPRKVIATAVARNRIKRLLRETFRLNQQEIAGLDVVARVRGRLTDVDLSRTFLASLRKCASCVRCRRVDAAVTTQDQSTEPL